MTASDGVVTACIPTFQAETFIDRTLHSARQQTHDAQRILVSIDQSDDATEEICRAHARDDDRIEVHSQAERLGWVDNVNFLLDSVRSEFAFIYFHDDVIEPTYIERLVAALRHRPDAASAHCDVVQTGGTGQPLRRGCAYEGTPAQRLLTYFVHPDRGELLRSMVRTASPAGRLRMPAAAALYEMALVAAGPGVWVAEPLYRRWNNRQGGLTAGWKRQPFDDIVKGCRNNAVGAQRVASDLHPSTDEWELLNFGLAVYMTNRLRWLEAAYDAPGVVELEEVLGTPTPLDVPAAVEGLPGPLRELCETASERARGRNAGRARRVAGPGTNA